MNEYRILAWNITQLAYELHKDLGLCATDFERSNCKGIYTRQMRELRDKKLSYNEPFTPGEIAVLEEFGISLDPNPLPPCNCEWCITQKD